MVARTTGAKELKAKLTRLGNKARRETRNTVEVGYSAPYAIIVHELVEEKLKGIPRPSGRGVYWGPHGQSKFLDKPAVALRAQIAGRISAVTKSTGSVYRGLYSGGVLLRDASLYLVPVEYGLLRDSVYIETVYYK